MQQKKIERQDRILLSLKKLNFLTRSQLQRMHNLKSDRNAQRVLKNMENYLNVFRDGQNIYYLNKKGRERVESDKIIKKTHNVNHYIMRNELYIQFGQPKTWRNEIRIINQNNHGKLIVVADALFEANNQTYIIEVDNTQSMKNNRTKIEKYRRLIERNAFGGMPFMIWITTTEYRRKKLLELCDGLNIKVFLPTDFK